MNLDFLIDNSDRFVLYFQQLLWMSITWLQPVASLEAGSWPKDWNSGSLKLKTNTGTEIWKFWMTRLRPRFKIMIILQHWDRGGGNRPLMGKSPRLFQIYTIFEIVSSFQSDFNCETRKYQRCWNRDSTRLLNIEVVETKTDRDR